MMSITALWALELSAHPQGSANLARAFGNAGGMAHPAAAPGTGPSALVIAALGIVSLLLLHRNR